MDVIRSSDKSPFNALIKEHIYFYITLKHFDNYFIIFGFLLIHCVLFYAFKNIILRSNL